MASAGARGRSADPWLGRGSESDDPELDQLPRGGDMKAFIGRRVGIYFHPAVLSDGPSE